MAALVSSDTMSATESRGRFYVGTSGFSYPTWVPKFYAPGKVSRKLLVAYAARLPAVELHNTFYRRPNDQQITKWLGETPAEFRFCPKAQRSTAWRAWSEADPTEAIGWLTEALSGFGARLGCVLMSPRGTVERDDVQLRRVLDAWPGDMPLALELLHPSWQAEPIRGLLAERGVALVANDWDDSDEPELRRAGPFVYLRLRRSSYGHADIERWAERITDRLAGGATVFAFFRHDDDGEMALHAEALRIAVDDASGSPA